MAMQTQNLKLVLLYATYISNMNTLFSSHIAILYNNYIQHVTVS